MFAFLKKIIKSNSMQDFKFHGYFAEEADNNNGLILNNFYLPEEIITHILSYVEPDEVLKLALVCKKWCNIIKSDAYWSMKYSRKCKKKAKKLPWYVYYAFFALNWFDRNLIQNGNGQDKYKHWIIRKNYGDCFRIENPPNGAEPLPENVEEFNGFKSCFATSYYECNKVQVISLKSCRLMQLILDKFKPHIYVSEWYTGRFDCACKYRLSVQLLNEENLLVDNTATDSLDQWTSPPWKKMEITIDNYPQGVNSIVFEHEGVDRQFWKGHYGSKMAGGVVKILFDSISETNAEDDDEDM